MSETRQTILDIGDIRGRTVDFEVDGLPQKAHKTWFRGDTCNFNPTFENMRGANAVLDHILAGWLPPAPAIDRHTNIMAFGSCFARHIGAWLERKNYNIVNRKDGDWGETYIARFGEGMVNSYAILQQFEWAFEGKALTEALWFDEEATSHDYDESIRLRTRDAMLASDVFIITLGLSEVWSDKATGDVFWRAVPQDAFDPEKHEFRVSSPQENLENLRRIHRLIRKNKPDAKIIFTLSPIPLVATFRPVSCITANSASKAILRAALDEFLREGQPEDCNLHYWPSYEIVMEGFSNSWNDDRRHVKTRILDYIMVLFEHVWCAGTPKMGLAQAWVRARCAAGDLPGRVYEFMEAGKSEQVNRLMAKKSPEEQELVQQAWAELKAQAPDGGVSETSL